MISLKDYALEKLFINEAYNVSVENDTELRNFLLKNIVSKNVNDLNIDDLISFLSKYIKTLTFDDGSDKKPVKIKRSSFESIRDEFFEEFGEFIENDVKNTDKFKLILNKEGDYITFVKGDGSAGKYTKEGDSVGQYAEAIVCWIFNNYKNPKPDNKDILNKISQIEEEQNFKFDKKWKQSFFLIVNKINEEWNNDEYIAVHVDAKDIDKDTNKNDYAYEIARIYSGKNHIKQIFKNDKHISFEFLPSKKDIWNKADIVLVKKNIKFDLKNELTALFIPTGEKINGENALNQILNGRVVSGDIIPISLKEITDTAYMYQKNFPGQGSAINVKETYIKLPTKIDGKNYSATMWLCCVLEDNKTLYGVQFRAQLDSTDNLSIESGLPGNKNARGGKSVTLVKASLEISKNDDYMIKPNSIEDLAQKLIDTGFDIKDVNNNEYKNVAELTEYFKRLNVPENYKPIYERTCFKGFLGIYEKFSKIFKKKNPNNINDIHLDFATNVLSKCVEGNGTSSFYIIS